MLFRSERVEVLRDGASSVYGSDAVGGVINYVLRRDFAGAETSVRFGAPSAGGGESVQGTLTLGTPFANGRGRLFATVEALYRDFEAEARFLNVDYGQYLLFDQNLIHGNRVNTETTTRWTFNCRFKGLFTPYADKRLGEFFEPITMRPTTRLGLAYKLPDGFEE